MQKSRLMWIEARFDIMEHDMTDYLFPPAPQASVPIEGEEAHYPIRRIFCVGRNYAAHAAEMGSEVDREAPFYFTKTPFSVLQSGGVLPYPPGTGDLHHEMELAFALGEDVFECDRDKALQAVYAYGTALDMTRRDLQAQAKEKRRPWDLGKDFEAAAVLAPMVRAQSFGTVGPQSLWLDVNGTRRQEAVLSDMIHDVGGIIADLSKFYHLGAGDVILTGTPAGVGPVVAGDHLCGGIDGLPEIEVTIV